MDGAMVSILGSAIGVVPVVESVQRRCSGNPRVRRRHLTSVLVGARNLETSCQHQRHLDLPVAAATAADVGQLSEQLTFLLLIGVTPCHGAVVAVQWAAAD